MQYLHAPAVRTVIFAAMVVALSGCAGRAANQTANSALPEIPLVYSSCQRCAPLTDAQRREISDTIGEASPTRRDVWFVYVHSCDAERCRATVYFRPLESDGRVQRGELLFLDGAISSATRHEIAARLGSTYQPHVNHYVQVVTTEVAKGGADGPPSERDIPFNAPADLSNAELVNIVETARTAAAREDSKAATMPVRNISVEGDIIDVFLGWQSGGRSGGGAFVKLKRKGSTFTVASVGDWFS